MPMRHDIEDLATYADSNFDGGFYLWQEPKCERRFDHDGSPLTPKWRCKIGTGRPFETGGFGYTADDAIADALVSNQ